MADKGHESVSWAEVETLCAGLAKQIADSGFKPDCIIGIARGGWVPAIILSDMTGNHNVGSMRVRFYLGPGKKMKEPAIEQDVSMDVKDKRVLLVDDIADTGLSLKAAVGRLLKKGAKEVKVAALHKRNYTATQPDFCREATDRWVVYPWTRREHIRDGRK
jgi:hypoxanthine phosphoribosyltransferase